MSPEHRAESNQKFLGKVPESNRGMGTDGDSGGCWWLDIQTSTDMMFVCTHCQQEEARQGCIMAFVGSEAEREEMERKRTERAKRRKECQETLVVPHPIHARFSHAFPVARAIIHSLRVIDAKNSTSLVPPCSIFLVRVQHAKIRQVTGARRR